MTRFGLISDVHSNDSNLERALAVLGSRADWIVNLGDNIFRLDFSKPCSAERAIYLLKERKVIGIGGDHDRNFQEQTAEKLSPEAIAYLRQLKQSAHIKDKLFMIHANPIDNASYIYEPVGAKMVLNRSQYPIVIIGHTHIPVVFSNEGKQVNFAEPKTVALDLSKKYLLNPGSVGAPKDGRPPSCGIFDDDKNTFEVIFL